MYGTVADNVQGEAADSVPLPVSPTPEVLVRVEVVEEVEIMDVVGVALVFVVLIVARGAEGVVELVAVEDDVEVVAAISC